ncbi:hypothetical protein B0H11DRAFT_243960 [Mycena galericulata]|nr:hypothetical protein B0H11DRAFT_243960 [Mycena galericulata]
MLMIPLVCLLSGLEQAHGKIVALKEALFQWSWSRRTGDRRPCVSEAVEVLVVPAEKPIEWQQTTQGILVGACI